MSQLELHNISAVSGAIIGRKADLEALSALIDSVIPELNAGAALEGEAATDAASPQQQLRS